MAVLHRLLAGRSARDRHGPLRGFRDDETAPAAAQERVAPCNDVDGDVDAVPLDVIASEAKQSPVSGSGGQRE
jgi:hypothetical protein